MPLIRYEPEKNFGKATMALIQMAVRIIDEYAERGFDLTLRQLYYQFVARGYLRNKQKEYNRLGRVVAQARMQGLIDWDSIVDRTRTLRRNNHWSSPEGIIRASAKGYRIDLWDDQPVRVEIEKDALVGVIEGVCIENDVPYFSCRGYSSLSAMWRAARRMRRDGRKTILLHLGDHDPSGIDMTRDIQDRLETFGADVFVDRIALTWEQIEQYDPPPNPTKLSDSRAADYVAEHGHESWELDALDPSDMVDLIQGAIEEHRDDELWDEAVDRQEEERRSLKLLADHYEAALKAAKEAR